MANVTTGKFLRFEAADADGITTLLKVIAILWVANDGTNMDIAADDDMTITDGNDAELVSMRCEAIPTGAALTMTWPYDSPLRLMGIKVPVLEGGVIYVWLKDPVSSTG